MSSAGVKAAYRPDIDGLRAVAVLAVVFYHLFERGFGGGFLGVDIFFVISGFLITGILNREIEQGNFSITRFYERRVRRILPALILIVALVFVATLFFFLPFDLIGFSKSVLATFAFVSNIYFWRDADYFGADAITKPLLHTWSLGIEEQFYILFPWLLWVVTRVGGRRSMLACIVLLSIGSYLLAALTLAHLKPQPAFYLLPMRAWELGIGAALALTTLKPPSDAKVREPLAIAGGLLVLGSCVFMGTGWDPMPAATPACLGTALLIWTGEGDTSVKRLLSLRPVVFVGLISYSLYLWHWPVAVLAQYLLIRAPTWVESLGLFAVSIAGAILSWRFVERPFRSRTMAIRRVLLWTASGVALLSAGAALVILLNGLPQRFSPEATRFNRVAGTNYRCPVTDYLPFGGLYACALNLPDRDPASSEVALIGNSHAQAYAPMIAPELVKRHLKGILVPVAACLPVRNFNVSAECVTMSENNLRGVEQLKHVRIVIVSIGWHTAYSPMYDRAGHELGQVRWPMLRAAVEDTIRRFRAKGWQVIVTGPIPRPGYNLASTVGREIAFYGKAKSPLSQSRSIFDRRYGVVEAWLRTRPLGAIPVFPSVKFCDSTRCSFIVDGQPAFADDNHLSQLLAESFRPLFGRALDEAQRVPAPQRTSGTAQ